MGIVKSLLEMPRRMAESLVQRYAPALPWRKATKAPSFPEWQDQVYKVSADGYHAIRTAPPTAKPVRKLAEHVAGRSIVAVCEEDTDRAEAIQYILDRMPGTPEMLRWLTWGLVEGSTFYNLVGLPKPVNGFFIPDLRGGGRRRVQCGGNLYWDGSTIMKAREDGAVLATPEERAAAVMPRERFIVYSCGGSGSPNGDGDLAIMLYLLAQGYQGNSRNRHEYRERHGLPLRLVKKALDAMGAGNVPTRMANAAEKLAIAQRSAMAISDKDAVEMLEPTGATWQFLLEDERALERVASELVSLEALTSGPASAGPDTRGNTNVAEGQLNTAIETLCLSIAEALTDDLLPFILAYNAAKIPGGLDGAVVHFELAAPVPTVKVAASEAREFAKLTEVDTQWLYSLHGATVPPGTPPYIKLQASPAPSPFGLPDDADASPSQALARANLAAGCPVHGLAASKKKRPVTELDALVTAMSNELQREFTMAFQRVAQRVAAGKAGVTLPESLGFSLAKGRALADMAGRARANTGLLGMGVEPPLPPSPPGVAPPKPNPRRIVVDVQECTNLPFKQAVQEFAKRQAIPASTAAEVAAVYERGAFSALRVIGDTMLNEAREKLVTFLETGADPKGFTKWMLEQNPDAGKGYADMVFRTNVNEAYSAGQRKQYEAVADQLGGWEYLTALDDSVRPEHAKLHGKVFGFDAHGMMFMPPTDYNCRCNSAPVPIGTAQTPRGEYGELVQGLNPSFLRKPGIEEYGS